MAQQLTDNVFFLQRTSINSQCSLRGLQPFVTSNQEKTIYSSDFSNTRLTCVCVCIHTHIGKRHKHIFKKFKNLARGLMVLVFKSQFSGDRARDRQIFVSLSPAWSTEQVPGQSKLLYSEILSEKKNKNQKQQQQKFKKAI